MQSLDALTTDEVSRLKLELLKDELFLNFISENEKVIVNLSIKDREKMEKYLSNPKKAILKKLGFDTTTYSKEIKAYSKTDKYKLLEEIAIITFEVFDIQCDKEINISIE